MHTKKEENDVLTFEKKRRAKLPPPPLLLIGINQKSDFNQIFERILDAFKLNRFQPNFKHSSLMACVVQIIQNDIKEPSPIKE